MARNKDKPDIPPGTPFQRVRPMLITFFVVAISVVLWQQRHGIGLSRDNSHLE